MDGETNEQVAGSTEPAQAEGEVTASTDAEATPEEVGGTESTAPENTESSPQ